MVLRKQNEIDKFIEFIDREWKLSIVEQEVLDSFLNLFLAGKNTEIKKVEHLLNDETEELLKLLNDREVLDYAIDLGGFIASDDESGLVDALDDLKYDFSEKLDLDEHIEIVEDHGYNVTELRVKHQADIVTQSDLEEMTELFLNLSPQKRNEIINNLK